MGEEIERASAEAVELADEHDADLAASCRFHHLHQSGAVVIGAAAGLLDIKGNAKAVALGGVVSLASRRVGGLVDSAHSVVERGALGRVR